MENFKEIASDFKRNKPIKGKHRPIGPGTDKGLYNKGFLEGDIYITKGVSKALCMFIS